MNSLTKNEILGVGISSATEKEILEYIITSVRNPHEPYYVVTPNPEILTYAVIHPQYKAILNKAELALCDGVGVFLASKLLGRPVKAKVTGVDLLESLCKRAAHEHDKDEENAVTIGFLGAGKGVALKAAERLVERYPGLRVVFVSEEWDDEGFSRGDKSNANGALQNIQYKKPNTIDILFVAFGFPKQEEWMAKHVGVLPVKVMMGVGGALDYISGSVPRAPQIIRAIGFEWLFRLIRQPWRLKRQLALPKFLFFVMREKLSL